ncbi:MAG: chromosome segregation protein SMC [Pirellulales bacterium]
MLKALELIGFKSFVDKTRFEFPPGVTVVVGPNGSGKSNVVDAIKWVLGAQSVKSLRGREMADVIFNGSPARRPMNTAEATLTFDNSKRILAVDQAEVSVTRRVYRSGEGEYLINRQPCRLRDIRDLFAGTGIATEAYSIIEQGKVDVMLQSSPRDRRVIFEEAAGISRFKAKKLEATRRLERVEQNLLRLSDIVDEVDSRLRSVRMQATKAQRFQEYTDRLQDLRTQVGLADWRALSTKIDALDESLTGLCSERDRHGTQIEAMESEALSLETKIADEETAIRESEALIAQNRERIASHESTIEHERTRSRDLEDEVHRHRRQLAAMRHRAGNLQQQLHDTRQAVEEAESQYEQVRQSLRQDDQALAELTQQWDQARREADARHSRHMEYLRRAAEFGNRISALESQAEAAQQAAERCATQIAELESTRQRLQDEFEAHQATQQELAAKAESCGRELREAQSTLADARRQLSRANKELAQLQGRYTGAKERADLLAELERRQEGMGAGVKQVLVEARQNPQGIYRHVRGMVADLVHVHVETARVIEVALGDRAQALVVADAGQLIQQLQQQPVQFSGRVSFLPLEGEAPADAADRADLTGRTGVLGRADSFVQAPAELASLVRRLLGRTWLVDHLDRALALAEGPGRGANFVTLAAELLAADGTISLGPRKVSTGIISRRSELRALQEQISELAKAIHQSETTVADLESQIARQDGQVQQLGEEHERHAGALSDQRLKTAASEERLEQLDRQHATLSQEHLAANSQQESATRQLAAVRDQHEQNETQRVSLEKQLDDDRAELDALGKRRAALQQNSTGHHVAVAKSEQRLDGLRDQLRQLQHDQQERSHVLAEHRTQLASCLTRLEQSQRNTLSAESEVAELYLQKENLAAATVERVNQREFCRTQRNDIDSQLRDIRQKLRAVENQVHEKEMDRSQLDHDRTTLSDRLREDYGIEIGQVHEAETAEELRQREQVEQEIGDLRRKIQNIGGVNLEALDELQDLESRHALLSAQHEDLTRAKSSLDQIIGKINADSRRLFAETLETVRGHFQSLFRKLFGGGQADIVLDEGADVDILESGIEIVARPPGKEPSSISLLSGGEKTLTCVALLLSIFRSRPSPFCVLDEVDAALDEANTERFIGVITEFLSSTQFVVVTHKKKTMTAADTLYGITMQESGISKRVSVRFEDVSEDGHISESAIEANRQEASATSDSVEDDETQAA